MFCSNCGKEVTGKFCTNCGAPMETENSIDQNSDFFTEVNGVKFNLSEMLRANDKDRTKMIVKMNKSTGFDFGKIYDLLDDASEKTGIYFEHAANKKNNIARCPKCGSTSLSTSKKGFGIGKSVVGAAIVGPIGLVAGGIGSKKIKVTCLKCGHQFTPNN